MKHGKMILGELHADIPVIQGGMGVGISLSGLAGAVAAAGGIGIISTAQIGFREPDFDRDPIACNLRTTGKEIEKARQIARGGIVGVNIMVATQRYEDYVRAAVLAGTDCIISGAGLPLDLPGIVAETESGMPGRSHRTMLAPIVSSTRALSVVTKYWMKKYDRKPDFIVAEGPLAGGHLGFKREELDAYTLENYERELTAMIRQAAELEIPLIAAGGIYDRRDLEHCLYLGAAGVQLGTRFLASTECNIHETYQKLVLSAKDTDSIVTGRFTGHPCRGIKTKFSRGLLKFEQNGGTPEEFERMTVGALRKAVQDGNVAEGSFLCGAIAGMIHEVKPCKEIVEEIFAQAQQLLGSTAVGREVEA